MHTNQQDKPEKSDFERSLDRWNWGAFTLTALWGLWNRKNLYLCTLLAFIPFCILISSITSTEVSSFLIWSYLIILLVIKFTYGAYGNQWSWKNKKWESPEAFQQSQKKWSKVGLWILAILVVIVSVFYFVLTPLLIHHSEAVIKTEFAILKENKKVQLALGTPIQLIKKDDPAFAGHETERTFFSLSSSALNAYAALYVRGSKNDGHATGRLLRKNGEWIVTQMTLSTKPIDGQSTTIPIVPNDEPEGKDCYQQSDSSYRRNILGSWLQKEEFSTSTTEYQKDGTAIMTLLEKDKPKEETILVHGTWKIENGHLIEKAQTYQKGSSSPVASSSESIDKIICLGPQKFKGIESDMKVYYKTKTTMPLS